MGTDTLYVDGFSGADTGWTTVGASPYLNDSDSNDVETNYAGRAEDWFSFADSTHILTTINSVKLYFEALSTNEDYVRCYIKATGVSSTNVGTIKITPKYSYYWFNITLTSLLNTWTKINSAQLELLSIENISFGNLRVRRAYLYVDWTQNYVDYYRTVSDIMGGVDGISKYKGATRTVSDKLGGLEAVTRSRYTNWLRTVADKMGGLEGIGKFKGANRTVSDKMGGVDSVPAKFKAASRLVAEKMAGKDKVTFLTHRFHKWIYHKHEHPKQRIIKS